MIIKLIIYLLLTVSGLMLFKLGGSKMAISLSLKGIDMSLSMIALLGIVCYGCSFLLWLNIIKESEISYIFPIASGAVTILTVIGGVILLGEKIQGLQIIGIVCIVIGSILVNICK